MRVSWPFTASQTLMVWSLLPLARRLPSGLQLRLVTALLCPLSVKVSRPFAVSQTLMVLSKLPLARRLPSGLQFTLVTPLVGRLSAVVDVRGSMPPAGSFRRGGVPDRKSYLAVRGIPDLDGVIPAPTGQAFAIGAPTHARDAIPVSLEREDFLAACHIPDLDSVVFTPAGQAFAVRAPAHALDHICVPPERALILLKELREVVVLPAAVIPATGVQIIVRVPGLAVVPELLGAADIANVEQMLGTFELTGFLLLLTNRFLSLHLGIRRFLVGTQSLLPCLLLLISRFTARPRSRFAASLSFSAEALKSVEMTPRATMVRTAATAADVAKARCRFTQRRIAPPRVPDRPAPAHPQASASISVARSRAWHTVPLAWRIAFRQIASRAGGTAGIFRGAVALCPLAPGPVGGQGQSPRTAACR